MKDPTRTTQLVASAFGAGIIGLLGVSTALLAAEFWTSKPVREWSQRETLQFFRNSPWVHEVQVVEPALRAGPLPRPTEGGVPDQTETGGQTTPCPSCGSRTFGTGPMADISGASEQRIVPYYIQWSSSKIVRRALSHVNALQSNAQEPPEEEIPLLPVYLLSIGGPDMRAFEGVTQEQLKAGTSLRPKSAKTKVGPDEVQIMSGEDERVRGVQLAFPRELGGQPVISDQEKSVEFSCKVKGLTLRTSFNLAKMVTAQGRDL